MRRKNIKPRLPQSAKKQRNIIFYASFCHQQKKEAEPSARLQRSVFLVGWTPPFCSAKTEKPSIPKNAAKGELLRTKRPPLKTPGTAKGFAL